MKPEGIPIRSGVRRPGAEQLILLSLVSFAATVIITRLFLELTGYPQIGNSELHIAHVLWGGLLLFIAVLMPLIFLNQWAFTSAAVLSGTGVGLFIDEVGKFITQSNDYFYPPAAPIIYGFFLLTVLIYFQIRKEKKITPRIRLYHALHGMAEVLDNDLDADEKKALVSELKTVAQTKKEPEFSHLANELLKFLEGEEVRVVERKPNFWIHIRDRILASLENFFTQRITRIALVVLLGILSLTSIIEVISLLIYRFYPNFQFPLPLFLTIGEISPRYNINWFLLRVGLQAALGILSLAALILIFIGKEQRGLFWAQVSMILGLTGLNLIVFYIDQFSAVISTLYQFVIVLLISSYRKRFLVKPATNRPLMKMEKANPG